jgi:PAS domain S-box-containing protein
MGRARILLLMANKENGRLLAEWLGPRFDVVVPDAPEVPAAPFDLCVLDGPSLELHREALQARKAAESPGFLPVLLVTPRKGLRLAVRYLSTAVDELIVMPIEKVELQARIEILLRARTASVELRRHGEELFTALVEQSLVGVYLARDGHYVYFNEAGAAIFGYTPAQMVRQLGPLDLSHRGDHALIAEHTRRIEKDGAPSAHYTFRGVRKDGSIVHCEVYERMTMYEGQRARLGTLLDVSERMRLEADRTKFHEDQLQALRDADLMKDQFLGILSHELRTPINAITGFGSILDDELAGPLAPQQHEYLRKILGGAEVLLVLVNDLLDMSRIQAGKFTLAFEPTDVRQVVADAVATLTALALQKHLELLLDLPQALPVIRADPQRVGQIITNLVSNAVKFTPEGGRIRVHGRLDLQGRLRFEVEDTGPGIAEGDVARLFQPFTQLDMSFTRQAPGTGLGLSIAKALVEAHGGTIGVRSEPGAGSTFWFTLPGPEADADPGAA